MVAVGTGDAQQLSIWRIGLMGLGGTENCVTSPCSYVGTAGWSVPGPLADQFGNGSSHLERYASRLNAVEINSSFYRPHRRATYERWAASVPDGFRFAVKLPRTITHEHRLSDCDDLLGLFAQEVCGLGIKRGPILVQLPPSLALNGAVARRFFVQAHTILRGAIVCEPRHESWFSEGASALLAEQHIARVAADPSVVPNGLQPGGWRGVSYFRLHGTPKVYRSDYAAAAIGRHAALVRDMLSAGREVWTIFDNTAAGHAPANALALVSRCASIRMT